MNNSVRFGSFILSCAIAGAVFAQATPPASQPGASSEFGSIDSNKDGKVSSTEAQSNSELRSSFSSLDADKDTYLSQSEFAKWNKGGKSGAMPAPGADRSGAAGGASSNSSSDHKGASPQSAPQSTDSAQ